VTESPQQSPKSSATNGPGELQPTGNGLKKRSADLSPTGPPLASFLRLLVLFVPSPAIFAKTAHFGATHATATSF
jgi:hypothetical protein